MFRIPRSGTTRYLQSFIPTTIRTHNQHNYGEREENIMKTRGGRDVFLACFLEEARDVAFRRSDGSEFQTFGARKLKER